MPIFVDFAGMNTLVSSSIDGNTLSSGKNTRIKNIQNNELVGINIHRNGPYGYSTWRQLRVSENPITRHHVANSTMTFVTQPGPIRNILEEGQLRVRDRYSALYTFTEPAIAQKSYPLLWNVGMHFRDTSGPLDTRNVFKFSMLSTFANQSIGFANEKVNTLHNFNPDEEKKDYKLLYNFYANDGLNKEETPISHWEFLRYRETVYPHIKNQFQNENLERPNFVSFYRHNRANRTKQIQDTEHKFGMTTDLLSGDLSQSSWVLDEHQNFLSRSYNTIDKSVEFNNSTDGVDGASYFRNGEGILMNTLAQFSSEISDKSGAGTGDINSTNPTHIREGARSLDNLMSPGPLYMRRTSLSSTASVSNPSGMVIPQTGGLSTIKMFQGGALWEAGSTRQIKDENGNYISAPKKPFYDTYEAYIEEARRRYKNFSVVPEFRMSTQVEDYLTNDVSIELDMFDVTGGANNAQNSSQSEFYKIYSNSDFMRQFELLNKDHKELTNGKVLSLRCKAIKKFLPYEGFYPAQRTVDLTKRFYDSYKDHISLYNANAVQLPNFNFGRQFVLTPLFAPGILFNSIKSGVAVDYPIITGSLTVKNTNGGFTINKSFDHRVPFEAIIEPKDHLSSIPLTTNEPHPSGNLSASAIWDGSGDDLYSKMANNFFAAVPEFFLPNGNFTSIVSKKQGDGFILEKDKVYGMRVFMAKSYDKPRVFVYHNGASSLAYPPPQDIIRTGEDSFRENFTMYSRPSAFGPPTFGAAQFSGTPFTFDQARLRYSTTTPSEQRNSVLGFNFPFTPPYYHGEAWCDIWITGSGETLTIDQIQAQSTASFTRFDNSFYTSNGVSMPVSSYPGPQSYATSTPKPYESILDKNALQLSASLNIFGVGKTSEKNENQLIVDTSLDQNARWVIQTKFETPMLNFNHISEAGGTLSVPTYGPASVPRGIWHQYGRIPEENEGVSIGVKPINTNWQIKVLGRDGSSAAKAQMENLADVLGFSGLSNKVGRIRSSKTVYEAVVAIPFIEESGDKKFFSIDTTMVQKYKAGGEIKNSLTQGDPQNQIGRSVLNQLQKMEKYIFPPSLDFLNGDELSIKPIAMYIFEFSHTFSQQDLSDIWQNLPPDIGTTMEESEVAITHPLLQKELLGDGSNQSGNTLIDMPNKLRWMVFKVKQRAASNYFKKTVVKNPNVNANAESSDVTQDEFGSTTNIQYNWPYDFFSLVELVRLDAEVEFGNFNEEDIANYTDSIPPYEALTANEERIEYIVGDMNDGILADADGGVEYEEDEADTGSGTPEQDTGLESPFAVPSEIPEEERAYYFQAKIRFVMEADADPLGIEGSQRFGVVPIETVMAQASHQLRLRTDASLFNNGIIPPGFTLGGSGGVTNETYLRWEAWTEDWYNLDPRFQIKKEEALAKFEAAQGAIARSQAPTYDETKAEARLFTGRRFYIELDKAFVGKKKAANRALESFRTKYQNNQFFDTEMETEITNLVTRLKDTSNRGLEIERPQYF